MRKTRPRIIKNPEDPIPTQIFQRAILDMSEAAKKLNNGPLKRRAVTLLIQDAVGANKISRTQIELVLDAAEELGRTYLK